MAGKKILKTCEVCGKEYMGISISKTCSDACKKELRRMTEAIWKAEQRGKRNGKKEMSELARINEEARQNGMTYGQYVAFCEMTGRR